MGGRGTGRDRIAPGLLIAVLLGAHLAVPAVTSAVPASAEVSRPAGPVLGPPVPAPAETSPRPAAPDLVPWAGPVEHLFFHTVVIRPDLAFADDRLGAGLRDYMVTARELGLILEGLWRNGWTLVDIHRAAESTVRVPRGRRPLVISEDDVNYYDYGRTRGQAWRLVLDGDGSVKVEVRDDRGTRVTDEDLVPMVDDFVRRHPDFSADGAKGVLAVTAYEGVLGERVDPAEPAAAARASAVARVLRATGWTFASHTFGHISLDHASPQRIAGDTERWKRVAEPVLGPTDVLIYPYGARPRGPARRQLAAAGFSIQLDIDVLPRLDREDGLVLMSRRHVDGLAFEHPERLLPFFDVAAVQDPLRR